MAAAAVAGVGNLLIAEQMIAVATERQSTASGDFFSRIGLFFSDPDGDLAAAEVALAEGDTALAVRKSRAAYEAWGSAKADGMKLLAIAAALLGALFVGGWLALHRLNREPEQHRVQSDAAGHFLEDKGSNVNWREWEKNSNSDDS